MVTVSEGTHVAITTALVVLYAFVTMCTVIGRQIYAVGGKSKGGEALRHQD